MEIPATASASTEYRFNVGILLTGPTSALHRFSYRGPIASSAGASIPSTPFPFLYTSNRAYFSLSAVRTQPLDFGNEGVAYVAEEGQLG